MPTPDLWTGYDFHVEVALRNTDGSAMNVEGATITAALVLAGVKLIDDTAQDAAAEGAAWEDGVVVIEFPAAATDIAEDAPEGCTPYLEISVATADRRIAFGPHPVRVRVGAITA